MIEAIIFPKHEPNGHLWLVEFTEYKAQNDRQRQIIDELGRDMMDRVLKIFLQVVTPGAYIEPGEAPQKMIVFPNRRFARHFVATFGGRWVRPA